MLKIILRNEAFSVFWQTILIGVNAAVIIPLRKNHLTIYFIVLPYIIYNLDDQHDCSPNNHTST